MDNSGGCKRVMELAMGEDTRALAYFGQLEGQLWDIHTKVSLDWNLWNQWKFIHIDDEDCAKDFGANYPSLGLLRFFDKDTYHLPAEVTTSVESVIKEMRLRQLPELLLFTEEYIRPVMNEDRTSVILFTENVPRDRVKSYFKEYEQLAHDMYNAHDYNDEDRLLFVTSGISFGIQIRLADFSGVTEEDLPALFIIKPRAEG